jgi:hypothetical protein
METLTGALAMGAAALIGKIVWDWFQTKKAKTEGHCSDHECLAREVVQLRMDWMAQNAKYEQSLAVIQNDLSYIKKKLDLNGSAK